MPMSFLKVDRFYDQASNLRAQFDSRFADPRQAGAGRFVWDYWHVPGQYTTLRTPAYHFFSKKSYDRFHQKLVWWGRRTLGCHDVSPPWMSCYVEGCRQELHGDLPHGPWAFVFSLTPWTKRKFTGGETYLLRNEILDHWRSLQPAQGLEDERIFQNIAPKMNRLTVFDPKIPHGVREVRGVQDVVLGRLVVHGWFVEPRPFIEGSLAPRELQSAIDDLTGEIGRLIENGLNITGMLSLRLRVSRAGRIVDARKLVSSLRAPSGDDRIEPALIRYIGKHVKAISFSRQRGFSNVTLPLIFS